MDFSPSSLMAGFVFGVLGFSLLKWGWKKSHTLHIVVGVVLMVYPYFVGGSTLLWGIGSGLVLIAYIYR